MGEPDQDGGSDGGGEVPEDEGAEQPGKPGLQGKEEEEVGGGGDGARHLGAEEHPAAGCPQGHGEGGKIKHNYLLSLHYSLFVLYFLIIKSNCQLFQVASYKKRILEQVSGVRN